MNHEQALKMMKLADHLEQAVGDEGYNARWWFATTDAAGTLVGVQRGAHTVACTGGYAACLFPDLDIESAAMASTLDKRARNHQNTANFAKYFGIRYDEAARIVGGGNPRTRTEQATYLRLVVEAHLDEWSPR